MLADLAPIDSCHRARVAAIDVAEVAELQVGRWGACPDGVAELHPCFLCLPFCPIFALSPLVSLGAGPVSRRPQSSSSGFIASHHAASLCQCGHVLWRALHCRPLSLALCPMSSRCVACRISSPLCFHPYRKPSKRLTTQGRRRRGFDSHLCSSQDEARRCSASRTLVFLVQ